MRAAFVWFISFFVFSSTAFPCTTFNLNQSTEKAYGKSYDWNSSHGFVFTNKRNVQKRALERIAMADPATWISKYGSITFSQHGKEMPLGGINEMGLVVDIMILGGSTYPTDTDRPTLNELQWIQYILDTSANTSEAVTNASQVHVEKNHAPVHYLVCDRTGDCATFEYIGEELVVHSGSDMFVNTLANSTYASSIANLRQYEGFGGSRAIPMLGSGSINRFVRASHFAKQFDVSVHDDQVSDYAFEILDSVRSFSTVWQLVYLTDSRTIEFKSRRTTGILELSMEGMDFSCASPVMYLDLTGEVTGDQSHTWNTYSGDANYQLVNAGNNSIGRPFSPEEVRLISSYPETLPCLDEQNN